MTKTQRNLVMQTERFHRSEQAVLVRRMGRDQAIQAAYLDGMGATEIAELTGLSRPYIHMLVREVKSNVA